MNLRKILDESGWTQTDMATCLDVCQSTVSRFHRLYESPKILANCAGIFAFLGLEPEIRADLQCKLKGNVRDCVSVFNFFETHRNFLAPIVPKHWVGIRDWKITEIIAYLEFLKSSWDTAQRWQELILKRSIVSLVQNEFAEGFLRRIFGEGVAQLIGQFAGVELHALKISVQAQQLYSLPCFRFQSIHEREFCEVVFHLGEFGARWGRAIKGFLSKFENWPQKPATAVQYLRGGGEEAFVYLEYEPKEEYLSYFNEIFVEFEVVECLRLLCGYGDFLETQSAHEKKAAQESHSTDKITTEDC